MFNHFLRKIFPFLYIRNWYSGQFELSTSRLVVSCVLFLLLGIFFVVAYVLGKPITYIK